MFAVVLSPRDRFREGGCPMSWKICVRQRAPDAARRTHGEYHDQA